MVLVEMPRPPSMKIKTEEDEEIERLQVTTEREEWEKRDEKGE